MEPIMEEAGIIIAALGGLAVGLERQRSGHASGPGARFGGIRTFTLLGILSGIAGWLWIRDYAALAVVLLAGGSALIALGYAAAARRDPDATTEVAALVVIAAGAASGLGYWGLGGGVVAITTLLLVEKSRLHEIARELDDTSIRAGVRFGVMAIVILPLLPEGPFGPWGGIRPRNLWLAVLLFSGLSFAGYLARRIFRGSSGYAIAGILGGLISSTSVTLNFARLSRSARDQQHSLALGAIGASTVLFLRVTAATAALNARLAGVLMPYFALPFVIGVAVTALGWRWNKRSAEPKTEPDNPLQFWMSVQMAVLFQAVLYLVYWLGKSWGDRGLLASGAILGLTDVDALTISMARGSHGAPLETAAWAIAIGILSNTALKTAASLAIGSGRFRWIAASGLTLIGFGLILSLVFLR
jgi:uncharacterized membrane protein (DUF4010 family)